MIYRKINAEEYKIVTDCILAMWMNGYFKDQEYYQIIDRLNDFAKKCGISDKAESEG